MKTIRITLMALIAVSSCALFAHASLSISNTAPMSHEGLKCQQSNGVKVCPACNGSGKFGNNTCINCGGKGIVRTNGQRL